MDAMLAATAEAEERHFWFRGLRRTAQAMLTRALGGRTPRLIVDCGAGTGRNLDWLKAFGPVAGVELTGTGLAVARRFGRPMIQASVDALPLPDACADVVTSFDVLYCLPDEVEARSLREMTRILAPGGVALINVAALDLLRGSHSTLTHERRRYTAASLRRRVEAAGLVIDRLTYTNSLTFPLTLAARVADRLGGRAGTASTRDLQVPPAPINAVLDVALRLESVLIRGVAMPVGSSLLCVAHKPAA